MHYYTHNIGDYAVETKYMTFEQKGMYIDMLDRYATTGKPLDSQWLATLKRLTSDDAVDVVLALCFVEKDGYFHHKRMDELLSSYEEVVERNRKNAQKRSQKQRPFTSGNPVVTQSQSSGNPSGHITNNQEPITNKEKEKINQKDKETEPELPIALDVVDPKTKQIACPCDEIVDLYHECLPELNRVNKTLLSDPRKRAVKDRWKFLCADQGVSSKAQGLEQIQRYFNVVRKQPFLLGKNDRGWKADFDWLFKQSNFVKVLELKYDRKK